MCTLKRPQHKQSHSLWRKFTAFSTVVLLFTRNTRHSLIQNENVAYFRIKGWTLDEIPLSRMGFASVLLHYFESKVNMRMESLMGDGAAFLLLLKKVS